MLIGDLNGGGYSEIKRLFETITPLKALNITKIGGMTNINYLIYCTNKSYVFRIPSQSSQSIINRTKEEHIEKCLADIENIGAKCLYFDNKTGIKITEFIKGDTLEKTNIKEHFISLASKLKDLHTSKLDFKYNFNPIDEMKVYLEFARNSGFWFDELDVGLELFYRSFEEIKKINQKHFNTELVFAPTHGDLVPQNILVSGEKITLIDWEYAGLNDPCWDLASFVLECELNKKDENDFLLAYQINDAQNQKIKHYKALVDILWAVWGVAKTDTETNYISYAKARLNAALSRA